MQADSPTKANKPEQRIDADLIVVAIGQVKLLRLKRRGTKRGVIDAMSSEMLEQLRTFCRATVLQVLRQQLKQLHGQGCGSEY